MNQVRRQACSVFPLLLCAAVLSACSFGRQPPPTRLYVLTSFAQTERRNPRETGAAGVAVGVGPVELPQYLDRPQIVTGESSNELQRAQFAQWAEPLEANFTRVLGENLSRLLATERVALFPWKGPVPLDYQVVVEVTHFLGTPGESASLIALWRVLGETGSETLVSRHSHFTEPTESADYAALAAAMSRTVAALSQDIAATITELSRRKTRP